jgi:hypothetical protein
MMRRATDETDKTSVPRAVRALARLIPPMERESILGDLLENAALRNLSGTRRTAWLAGECSAIGAGLSLQRVRAWFVVPPVREVVAGIAIDGRGALRDGAAGTILRGLVFVGSIATLVLGVELLVGSLMSAAGF